MSGSHRTLAPTTPPSGHLPRANPPVVGSLCGRTPLPTVCALAQAGQGDPNRPRSPCPAGQPAAVLTRVTGSDGPREAVAGPCLPSLHPWSGQQARVWGGVCLWDCIWELSVISL